jgi:Antirepressor regulating drug resistance, predicted signal transduction N-terminal membrane component
VNLTIFFHNLVSLSLLGSILAIGLLLIKLLLRQKLSANWHYYIWLVLILRLIIPFTPSTPFNLFNLIPHDQQTINLPQITIPNLKGVNTATVINGKSTTMSPGTLSEERNGQTSPVESAALGISWQTAALAWLIGILGIIFYILLINGLLLFKVRKLPICYSENILGILQECKSNLEIHSEVPLVYDATMKSPVLFGLFHPKIIISPELVKRLSPEELRNIFLHELSHLKRHDLAVNALVLSIQVIYWFNPLIMFALHQMKQDCEIACDATALVALKPEDHKKYGHTIINLLQLLSEPHWIPGRLGFISKFNTRRNVMISKFKKTKIKWAVVTLALTLVVGCSSLSNPIASSNAGQNQNDTTTNSQQNSNTSTSNSASSSKSNSPQSTQATQPHPDSTEALLSNIMTLAKQGKVINSNFAAKTSVIDDVQKVWGTPEKTDWVGSAKGNYATYSSHHIVFGMNKGDQIFEVRSYDNELKSITLNKTKEVFGTPAYNVKSNGQEIIGYTAGTEFKIELVFPQPTSDNPNPFIDHYNVLYPQGTVNSMADDPGRQW